MPVMDDCSHCCGEGRLYFCRRHPLAFDCPCALDSESCPYCTPTEESDDDDLLPAG